MCVNRMVWTGPGWAVVVLMMRGQCSPPSSPWKAKVSRCLWEGNKMSDKYILYAFLHTGSGLPFKKIDIDEQELWEEVRYRLETKYHLQKAGSRDRHKHADGFLVGWLYQKGKNSAWYRAQNPLPSNHTCRHEQCLILARKPMQREQRPYVPVRFRPASHVSAFLPSLSESAGGPQFRDDMTEEEKIQLVILDAAKQNPRQPFRDRRLPVYASCHPSELSNDPLPSGQVCRRCGGTGHLQQSCPNGPKKVPTGIPRMFLRPAKTEEEKKDAMQAATGELVVFNQELASRY